MESNSKVMITILLIEGEYNLVIGLLTEELKKNTYDKTFIDIYFIHYSLAYCYYNNNVLDMCSVELKFLDILFKDEANRTTYNYDYKKYIELKRKVEELVA